MEQSPRWETESRVFQALSSPRRLQILELLHLSGGMTVGEIQQRLGIEPSNASQHLAVLRERGLVRGRREGTSIWYALADPATPALLDGAREIVDRRNRVTRSVRRPARR